MRDYNMGMENWMRQKPKPVKKYPIRGPVGFPQKYTPSGGVQSLIDQQGGLAAMYKKKRKYMKNYKPTPRDPNQLHDQLMVMGNQPGSGNPLEDGGRGRYPQPGYDRAGRIKAFAEQMVDQKMNPQQPPSIQDIIGDRMAQPHMGGSKASPMMGGPARPQQMPMQGQPQVMPQRQPQFNQQAQAPQQPMMRQNMQQQRQPQMNQSLNQGMQPNRGAGMQPGRLSGKAGKRKAPGIGGRGMFSRSGGY